MKFVSICELRNNGAKIWDILKEEDVVITRYGKPTATLALLNEDVIEEFLVTHNPKLLSELAQAYRECKEKGGATHTEMKRKIERYRG